MNGTSENDEIRSTSREVERERADRESFIARLESLIPPRGETAFAREAGISPGGLRGAKKNGNPGREMLVKIARAADVSVEWLATGEGPRYRQETDEKGGMPANARIQDEQKPAYRYTRIAVEDVADEVVNAFLWLKEIAATERLDPPRDALADLLRLAVSLPRIPENAAILARVMRQMCR